LSRIPLGIGAYFAAAANARDITLLCVLCALLTDFLDGRIARASGADNGAGIIIDTTADKIFLVALCSGMLQSHPGYNFPLAWIIAKEVIAVGLSATLLISAMLFGRSLSFDTFRPTIIGKVGFVLSALVTVMILTDSYTHLAQWIGALTIAVTSVNYIFVMRKRLIFAS
jgi:phosphatidylglycerophosphate synthase